LLRALAVAVVLLVVTACAGAGDDGTELAAGTAMAAGDVASGRALYAANCASCHGVDLQGTDKGPPHIHPVYEPSHHADDSFRLAVARGAAQHHWEFGPMPPIAGLADQDVTDIIAYVREQQRAAGIK
jgi:mono/diheme cytochrome c family protein